MLYRYLPAPYSMTFSFPEVMICSFLRSMDVLYMLYSILLVLFPFSFSTIFILYNLFICPGGGGGEVSPLSLSLGLPACPAWKKYLPAAARPFDHPQASGVVMVMIDR